MDIFAFKKKEAQFTADLWSFTETTDSTGNNVFHYFFVRNISFTAVTSVFGKMTAFFNDTESDVKINCQLQKLKDAGGNEMNPGFIWLIDQYAPEINIFNRKEGYRARIKFSGLVTQ